MAAQRQARKDPKGGLTTAGRRYYKEHDGAHLRPGVLGPADTPEKLKRKGSFLRRHYAHTHGALVDAHGDPTRRALAAHAWGEPIPRTDRDRRALADKGAKLLERYQRAKAKASAPRGSRTTPARPAKRSR